MVDFAPEATVIVMSVPLTHRVLKRIQERIASGLCLQCDRPIHRRLLCTCHYARWRAARSELPKKDRPTFDAKWIAAGKLGEDRQGQRGLNEYREHQSVGA